MTDALVHDEATGLPMLSYRRATDGLMQVAAADVTRVAQAVLAPGREIIAVTRPAGAAALAGSTKPAKAGAER